jgi:hypothetical protein
MAIKPTFSLKLQPDAKMFEQALDVLYPISTGFNDDNLKAKAIKNSGNEWTFVRGQDKFFDRVLLQGFVVKTDTKGAVVEVKWATELK